MSFRVSDDGLPPPPDAAIRAPVCAPPPPPTPAAAAASAGTRATGPSESANGEHVPVDAACLAEWERHVDGLTDQALEVMQGAYAIFARVYQQQGAVSGVKARALVLVALLYSSRTLHGSNEANEKHLLRRMPVPTRIMNKAITQMASVTLPVRTAPTGAVA